MRLFWRKQEAAANPAAPSQAGFATWRDPEVAKPSTDWMRRLDSYARRSARDLAQAAVPLFRAEYPRNGKDTYRDAFWIIAADVDAASRTQLCTTPDRAHRSPGDPPVPARGDFTGHIVGNALLLTKTGILCAAGFEAWFSRVGTISTQTMDMVVYDTRNDEQTMKGTDGWGWYNRGRWRRDPRADRLGMTTGSMRFERDFFRREVKDPGYGTSAALSHFVKGGGATRWPRNFLDYYSV